MNYLIAGATRSPIESRNPMQARRILMVRLSAVALSIMMATPAQAEKQICDGKLLCWIGVLPVVLVGAAFSGMVAPTEKWAEKYINEGEAPQLEHLLEMNPTLARDPAKGPPLLSRAVESGNMAVTQMLVKGGAAPSANHSAALLSAKTPEMVRYLIANGAAPTELNLAHLSRQITTTQAMEMLTIMLDARGKLGPDDAGALDLLSSAVSDGRADVVRLLLERGVKPNGGGRRAPLLVAARVYRVNGARNEDRMRGIARDLIASGADAKLIDEEYCRTASRGLERQDCTALTRLLEEAGR